MRDMSAFIELLGDELKGKDDTVSTAKSLQSAEVVGLYFSAHWCPPCRGFTPELAKQYKKIRDAGKAFEIVFVSSDKDEAAFDSYHAEQPWLALPFANRDAKAKLSKKFKVGGIPTLILLDGNTGELLNKDGRSAVMGDVEDFPWKPPTLWECLGSEFLKNDGDAVEVDELRAANTHIGLYFNAHWCPPCRGFTPELVKTYEKVRAAGHRFEIVFVSSDRSAADFKEYFKDMPWLAIPNGDKRKEKLSAHFEVEGIPTFVVLDAKTGEVVNGNARGAVGGDPEGAAFPWTPPPIGDMAQGVDGINEEPCVCLMLEGAPAEQRAALLQELTPVAEASKAAGDGLLFFVANDAEGPAPQIRALTQLGEPSGAQAVLLDIPDDGGFYTLGGALSADALAGFLKAYQAKELPRKQLQK